MTLTKTQKEKIKNLRKNDTDFALKYKKLEVGSLFPRSRRKIQYDQWKELVKSVV
jgi:hypothetical protein